MSSMVGPYLLDRVYQGDCLELMKALPDSSVDLVLTDPPYGIMKKEYEFENFDETFHGKWLLECSRILKKGGHFYSFFSQTHIPKLQPLIEQYFKLRNILIWHYPNNVGGYNGFLKGKYCYVKRWQPIFYATKDKPLLSVRTNWQRYNSNNYDVLIYAAPQKQFKDSKLHPMQKPLALTKHLINASSVDGGIVFDPFLGSGTTAVAAKRLGRRFLGFELNPDYVKLAERRLANVPRRLEEYL